MPKSATLQTCGSTKHARGAVSNKHADLRMYRRGGIEERYRVASAPISDPISPALKHLYFSGWMHGDLARVQHTACEGCGIHIHMVLRKP